MGFHYRWTKVYNHDQEYRWQADDDSVQESFLLKNHYDKIFNELIALLWEYFFKDVVDQYLIRFYDHQDAFQIGKLKIHQHGIDVAGTGLSFTWEELEFKAYTRFFVLSKRDKPEFHIWIDYNEWHTEILYSLIKTIITEKRTSNTVAASKKRLRL